MDALLDRLRVLNYQKDFCRLNGLKPLSRFYFESQAPNPNEQFFYFALLAVWLLRRSGRRYDHPLHQFDDPNATTTNLIEALKAAGFSCDYPPSKIRQAYGETVIELLTSLADRTLKSSGFKYQRPSFNVLDADETVPESTSVQEPSPSGVEDRTGLYDVNDSSDDENDVSLVFKRPSSIAPALLSPKPASEVETQAWKLEVERVTPLLKVVIANDNKDWRIHLQQMRQLTKNVHEIKDSVHSQLSKLQREMEGAVQKITSRESYINHHFEALANDFKVEQEQLQQIRKIYQANNGRVNELQDELNQVTEQLEAVKSQMDDLGSDMTNPKPLVMIKQALTQLKTELKEMDIRIGVAQYTVLHMHQHQKSQLMHQMAQPKLAVTTGKRLL